MKNLKLYESASNKSTKFKVVDTFTLAVRNPDSSLNNEKGSVIANFEKGDILDITIQSGSLGDLWSIRNLSTGESHSMWKYDYSSPRDMKVLKQAPDNVNVKKRVIQKPTVSAKPVDHEMSTTELEWQDKPTHTVTSPVEGLLRKGDKVFLDVAGERVIVIKGANVGMIVDLDADEIKSVLAPLSESTKSTKLKNIQMFEDFGRKELNEGSIKNLLTMIDATDGDADLDPGTQWTPEEAIEWGVGFEKKYGLWHPDEDARDIIWDNANKPKNLVKTDKQMENFSNVDWSRSNLGANLDQYVIVKFIKDAISAGSLQEGSRSDYYEREQKYGGISMTDILSNQKNIEKMLNDIGSVEALEYLDKLEKNVANDAKMAPSYKKLSDRDRSTIVSMIPKLRKKYIKPIKVNSKAGDVFAIDDNGVLHVNNVPVQVDDDNMFVKLGGNGRGSSRGAMYGAGYFDDQLQGISYVFTVQKFKRALLNGKSPEDALKEIWDQGNGMWGETVGKNTWPTVAKHLKIKL